MASLETKIDTVEAKLEVRLGSVETDIKAAKIARQTVGKFMAAGGVIIAAIWAAFMWIIPLLHYGLNSGIFGNFLGSNGPVPSTSSRPRARSSGVIAASSRWRISS